MLRMHGKDPEEAAKVMGTFPSHPFFFLILDDFISIS